MHRFYPRFAFFHHFAALMALLAVLVPLTTSILYHPAAFRSFVHICGVEHLGGESDKSPTHKLPPCPLCQNLHLIGGGLVPPPPLILAIVSVGVALYTWIPRISAARFALMPQARPRAPPASF